jgi:DNA-binding CsgD family transcriptional regulator
VPTPTSGLIGRKREIDRLAGMLADLPGRGSALVIRGDAGIGKSALLDVVAAEARADGVRVLSATGVETEAGLPFAGLHRLLLPVIPAMERLPPPQRAAVQSAFGRSDPAGADIFLVSLATLDLLAESASRTPILVLAEDAHWLDEPTRTVLGFVARRLEMEPIALLLTVRDDAGDFFERSGLPSLRLNPLDGADAGALLDMTAPGLTPEARALVLDTAAGNPLAITELPNVLSGDRLPTWLFAAPLPLTGRLERLFSGRLADLPGETRTLLLFAALDDGGGLQVVLAASEISEARRFGPDDLAPAVAHGLVAVESDRVVFRHPLVRSAVYQNAVAAQRRAAHAVLASVYDDDPERSVWHRAASRDHLDDEVAGELETLSVASLRRGAPAAAAAALERAAELAPEPRRRSELLVRAADLEFQLGRPDRAAQLLHEARPADLGERDRVLWSMLREMTDQRSWSGAGRLVSFARMTGEMVTAGDVERAVQALEAIALRCWWSNPDQATRDRLVETARMLPLPEDHPSRLFVLASCDPVREGAGVLRHLADIAVEREADPNALLMLGTAASASWADDLAMPFLSAAVDGLRAEGRLGVLVHALVGKAWSAVHTANAAVALPAAEEAYRLARETSQLRWGAVAQLAEATLAAERGQIVRAEALAAEAEALLVPIGANPLLSLVQLARGRVALAAGRHDDAYDQLVRIFDPADVAYQPLVRPMAITDLAEAAGQVDRREEARRHVAELEDDLAGGRPPMLWAALSCVRPVLADGDEAGRLYEAGLETDLRSWPRHRARLWLGYGKWLRRERRVAESRVPLRAARETFDALGFRPWADQARQELRAAGESSRRPPEAALDQLTPQEFQIAKLAAEGLSNREIGQQLFLSHRTVGSHLYRIFPKLGITSRFQLREALRVSVAADTMA